jgi:PKD repeat protein
VVKFTVAGNQVGDAGVLADKPLGGVDFPAVPLNDAGVDGVDLGTIAPDATAPTVTGVAASYSGAEGNPISFSATVTDGCGGDDVVWKFSDGATAYGPAISKAFADNGSYSGNVTATDDRGNKTVKNFTVNVTNQAPVANAGLGTVAEWGRPVSFHGQATDPGSADLSTLAYTWDLGDGSPSATGAQDVLHTYGAPGAYTATLTVTDKDGAVGQATRSVTVTKRAATLTYAGVTSGRHDKMATLSATLLDSRGQPVVGRMITFNLGAQKVTAWTNGWGTATASVKLTQKAGTYPLSAAFVEDAQYFGSTTPVQSFTITK